MPKLQKQRKPQKLENLIELLRLLRNGVVAVIVSCLATTISAQEIGNSDWEGEWLAEGTLFRIGVSIEAGILKVTQIESMGQVWSNEDGEIDGNIARVQVDYAGATGIIQAELINTNTAVLFANALANDILTVKVKELEPPDAFQYLCRFTQARLFGPWQIDLGYVTGHDHLRVETQPGEEHLHLLRGGVLSLVEHNERVVEGPSPHISERSYLDSSPLHEPGCLFGTQHLV